MQDNRLIVSAPINSLSLGQFSFNVIRELYRRKIQISLFPKGNVDMSAYKIDPQFGAWIERAVNDRLKKFDRKVPTLHLWHLNGSEFKVSDHQYTFTFHETDSPTENEINIVNQQDHTFFSSSWSVGNFEQYGAKNVSFVPLGFDEDFTEIKHRQVSNDIVHWVLCGKAEARKNTQLIITEWTKRYGGNKRHQLTTLVNNPFFQSDHMNAFYGGCFEGKPKPFNVNILPTLKTNAEVNQLFNSADIDLSGFSKSEGWGLPAFMMTALGKWSTVTNCSAHKDWATASNAILTEATEMTPVYDGVFFAQGQPFSQGNVYAFKAEQLHAAFDAAEKKAKTPNPEGRKLREQFTYKRTVDEILAKIPRVLNGGREKSSSKRMELDSKAM
jgi:hypothetical protein